MKDEKLIARALEVLTESICETDGMSKVRSLLNKAEWDNYGECDACDTNVPCHEGVCLLCGSPVEQYSESES